MIKKNRQQKKIKNFGLNQCRLAYQTRDPAYKIKITILKRIKINEFWSSTNPILKVIIKKKSIMRKRYKKNLSQPRLIFQTCDSSLDVGIKL